MRILAALVLAAIGLDPAVAQSAAIGLDPAAAQEAAPRLAGFPDSFVWHNQPAKWTLDQGKILTLTAPRKSDWFAWPGGGYRPDSSPRLLYRAADDFVISAKVTAQAHKIYDAGCLALFGTATSWAKFCLEARDDGRLAIVSVVTRDLSDDVTSFPVEGKSAWLKMAKADRAIMLYASTDGAAWTIVRKFNLESPAGFLSPEGEGATAIFEDVHYAPGRVDLWKLK